MDAHGSASVEHTHPSSMTYVKIGVVLFVLTALEVGLYEFTYGEHSGATGHALQPFFVPLLLALSAAKFALVAMFYMRAKAEVKLASRDTSRRSQASARSSPKPAAVPSTTASTGTGQRTTASTAA